MCLCLAFRNIRIYLYFAFMNIIRGLCFAFMNVIMCLCSDFINIKFLLGIIFECKIGKFEGLTCRVGHNSIYDNELISTGKLHVLSVT